VAKDNTLRPFSPKVVLRFFLMLLFPAALFVSAGRLNWVMAWVYVVTMLTFSLGSRLLAARKNPDLLVERQISGRSGCEKLGQGARPLGGDVRTVGCLGRVRFG